MEQKGENGWVEHHIVQDQKYLKKKQTNEQWKEGEKEIDTKYVS